MVHRALVAHSPLVGPSTSGPLAAALTDRGWHATAPDLRAGCTSPGAFAAMLEHSGDGVDVLVGHSGAGPFLPAAAAAVGASAAVFVDAVVPGDIGAFRPSPGLIALLDTLVEPDLMLRPWTSWWPEETMEELVPDAALREHICADVPRVPRAFYDEPVPFPPYWWRRPNAYVQLSPAYADDHERAVRWGWPTARLDGRHLDLVTRADAVAAAVAGLVDSLLGPADGSLAGP